MKHLKRKHIIALLSISLFIFSLNLNFDEVAATEIPVSGRSIQRDIDPYDSITFDFFNFRNLFTIKTDTFIDFNLDYDIFIIFRQISIVVNSTTPLFLNISCKFDLEGFLSDLPEDPTLEEVVLTYDYNCFYRIYSNSTIDNLKIQFMKNDLYGLNPSLNYSITFFKEGFGSWEPITTLEKDQNNSSGTYLEANLADVEGNTEYFLTVYKVNEEVPPPNNNWILLILVISLPSILLLMGILIVISKEEYIEFIKKKITSISKGAHRLSLKEVLNNKNRNKIIDIILNNPGIHFNQLLRKTNLSPGNLVWHLDILETYKVIGKKRFENYVVYFPLYQKNPISNLDLKLQKSDLTLKVLELIEENPGIWNSKINKKLKINRKTIQYHISKLIDLDLIYTIRDGRKKKIYLNTESEYFKNNNQQ